MRLIVGLGNPTPEYVGTRHNVGAMTIERAAARWGIALRAAGGLRSGRGVVEREPVALAGPVGWMNLSGPPVAALLKSADATLDDLIVVHDDLDLPAARLKIKRGGGAGGHNGILSIIESLACPDFYRVKIGIGRPAEGIDPADYVLSRFSDEEMKMMIPTIDAAVDALTAMLLDGPSAAMNRFNVRPQPDEPSET